MEEFSKHNKAGRAAMKAGMSRKTARKYISAGAWRALQGPERELMFGQAHQPGEAAQTDFTWAKELAVTISSEPFAHMLCVFVLPYSNWQWVTVWQHESDVICTPLNCQTKSCYKLSMRCTCSPRRRQN